MKLTNPLYVELGGDKFMTVYEKVKTIRRAKNIKQSVVAKALGITVQAYSMKETGKRPITTTELELIAKILRVPTTIFFENEFHFKWNEKEAIV